MHFPNGCHVCEIEVDPETGKIAVDRYVAVDDVGTIINPPIVHGQVHGGICQGLGQVFMEHCQYDDDGQFLTGSFMDYAMPRADNIPPSPRNFIPFRRRKIRWASRARASAASPGRFPR